MGASWQAFYAHLCAASIIRAMPETEIPPAMRGDHYCIPKTTLTWLGRYGVIAENNNASAKEDYSYGCLKILPDAL